ncbi:MAG: 4a-hydroxytetrahydrobiopterin dehydratase [Myxococcales bacterium]|nr:4a-hydroxytetrahydrobiopterin dehydratase [Myxococcales bacterium]
MGDFEAEISAFLQQNSTWRHEGDALLCSFVFTDFVQAFGWMSSVALIAERNGHHPEWRNVWATVDVRLCTHDAGNRVTTKDIALATEMTRLAAQHAA